MEDYQGGVTLEPIAILSSIGLYPKDHSPEWSIRKLAAAILERALIDLVSHGREYPRSVKREAAQWLKEPGMSPGSRDWCCFITGIQPQSVEAWARLWLRTRGKNRERMRKIVMNRR